MNFAQMVVKRRMYHARHPSIFIPIQFWAHNLGYKMGGESVYFPRTRSQIFTSMVIFRKNSKIENSK